MRCSEARLELQHARIANAKAPAVYDAFERGAYQLVNAHARGLAISGRHEAGAIEGVAL
jgi:hypothetical protein